MDPHFACVEKVDLTPRIDYESTKKKRCPKCAYEWTYRGKFIRIQCSRCHHGATDRQYMKDYRQSPKYKAYQKKRYAASKLEKIAA